jgi:cytochrome c553
MGVFRTIALFMASVAAARKAGAGDSDAAKNGKSGLKFRLRRIARHFAVFLLLLVVGGFLFAASGIYPIGASSGHWGVVSWFLNFSSRRAVETHTIGGGAAPSLDDPALVLRGAGHYETGCRPCHGGPDIPQPPVAAQMLPLPPYLPDVVPSWEPDELFYIVKNGLKFTGMPAWPTQVRDDEVWAMVAFLQALPEMGSQEYQRLVYGDTASNSGDAPIHDLLGPEEAPRAVVESCARCHGMDGLGRGEGAFPKLAGQSPSYFFAAMQAFARGDRHSGIMEPVAAGLDSVELRELALYYDRLQGLGPGADVDTSSAVGRGRAIALEGIPEQGVPSCADCHGPGTGSRNPFYPVLAGQYADYLVLQLELFQRDERGGSPYAHLMRQVASRLTPEQMRDVAAFYESLASAGG